MIKHVLTDWNIAVPRRAWWYKMQLFDPSQHAGPLLYFDLDTVIVRNIDWIWQQPTAYFWAVRDFKYLWRPASTGLNSSVMWWDTARYAHVWHEFLQQNLSNIMHRYHGDQDYISASIAENQRRMFDVDQIQSWRWQCVDGGYNFGKRRHHAPGSGTCISDAASVLIFHGNPKPDQVQDPVVLEHWR
jgi:hypothetical protein